MKFSRTSIPDVVVFEPEIHGDKRGYFMETWRKSWLQEIGIDLDFVQDNQSSSVRGTLRGLHFQISQPQGKYIRVVDGEIYDVVVDMRKKSPSFGKWEGVSLSAENRKSLWVPPGFAHGFLVTSETAVITYKCTDYYAAEHERSLLWNDPALGIDWPMAEESIILSDKDRNAMPLADCEYYP